MGLATYWYQKQTLIGQFSISVTGREFGTDLGFVIERRLFIRPLLHDLRSGRAEFCRYAIEAVFTNAIQLRVQRRVP